jgi:undecaprenyl-diphosphatase
MLNAIILGIVQGITEFFPISSTAHLVLLPKFFKWEGLLDSLQFDVALHAGTLVSLLLCFREDIISILTKRRELIAPLIVGTIPAGIAGVAFNDYVEHTFRSPALIAVMLVVFGLVMYGAERFKKTRSFASVGLLDALVVGLAQAVALVPGVSRSGITISAGLARGMKRDEAARFSFLLSIPVIGGATLLEGRKLFDGSMDVDLGLVAAGFAASLVTGVVAIQFLLGFLKRHSLNAFVIYRFILAGVIVGWLWLGA